MTDQSGCLSPIFVVELDKELRAIKENAVKVGVTDLNMAMEKFKEHTLRDKSQRNEEEWNVRRWCPNLLLSNI